MPRATVRRPLPALAFLLVLSVLTALVWWRVINRASEDNKASAQPSCPTSTAVAAVPQPAAVTVSVLNSTARNGLARTTSETLKKDGFDIGVVDNDTPGLTIAGVAQVRYGPSGKAAATLLSFYFPGATMVPVSRTDAQVVVSLGAQFKAVASPAAVKHALNAKHITQLPAARAGNLVQTPTTSGAASASTHC